MKNYHISNNWPLSKQHSGAMNPIYAPQIFKRIIWLLCFMLPVLSFKPLLALEDQETTSIYMVKTAEVTDRIYEVDNKRVHAQIYIVREGDSLWRILRKKGLLNRGNFPVLLSLVKKLNKSKRNMDLIHPGDKIIIPFKITSAPPHSGSQKPSPPPEPPARTERDNKFEYYKVKPGESLARVAARRYNIPPEDLYNEYLDLLKSMNPTLKDLSAVNAGQMVKLPIYSPGMFRQPIEPAFAPKPVSIGERGELSEKGDSLANGLGKIFVEMGEQWIHSGEHFVPFESGGFINLKASSYPIIDLQNGLKIIVDTKNALPWRIGNLIESTWPNYRVVHLMEKDDLRSALGKILSVCNYHKVLEKGEPLELEEDVTFRIKGDWIVSFSEAGSDNKPNFLVINLMDGHTRHTPWLVKRYLKRVGVKIIDYPSGDNNYRAGDIQESDILEVKTDPVSLIEGLLTLTNHHFSTQTEIPVYQSHKADLTVSIKADFFLRIKGSDALIDLTGLAPEIVTLLKEHQFLYLPLLAEKDPLQIVARTLEFLDIQFSPGRHSFVVDEKDYSRNVSLTLPGITFSDPTGKAIIATPANLQGGLAALLSEKGYKILLLNSLSRMKIPEHL
jgi:LysM repeat protein